MQSETSDQVQECSDSGNQFPFCYPVSTDVWTNGSTHNFIWNFNYPFYVGYEQISLYLYYIIKYEYVSVKNYTDLDRASGSVEVTVDDSWFLNPLPAGSPPSNLTMVAFYLPPTYSPYTEISSPISMFPRPFNFTVVQLAPPAVNTNNTNSTTTNSNENNDNSNNNNNNNNNSNNNNAYASSSHLPGWAIAVIVIAVIAFICGVAALIWAVLISRRNKRNNKLIPISGTARNTGKGGYNGSINSQTKVTAFRSTDSVPMTTASAGENASSIGTLAYAGYDSSNKLSSTDAVLLADTFRNTLGRSANDWNTSLEEQEQEELKRRRLGEVLLQRQLEEDGTSVKHAGRFTRVKSLADIQKSAVFEHPKY